MNLLITLLQVVVGLTILNVWLLRFGKATPYRGGNASTMMEEFAAYGLPKQAVYVVGFAKVTLAVLLLIGVWFRPVSFPAASILALFMLVAVGMHVKIHDSMKKTVPSLLLLLLSGAVAVAHYVAF